jgi:hypothetical protein
MHPEIEKLIDLALADGQITEKERKVILKKANEFGIDSDEVDMILDAKLHQIQTKNKVSNKIEEIKKCPSCGNTISGLSKTCLCGYIINSGSINESKSLEKSIEILESLIVQVRGLSGSSSKSTIQILIASVEKEIRYINTRYSDNKEVKKLIIELENLSSKYIQKALVTKKKRGIIIAVIVFVSILIYGLLVIKSNNIISENDAVESNFIKKIDSISNPKLKQKILDNKNIYLTNWSDFKKFFFEYYPDYNDGYVMFLSKKYNFSEEVTYKIADNQFNNIEKQFKEPIDFVLFDDKKNFRSLKSTAKVDSLFILKMISNERWVLKKKIDDKINSIQNVEFKSYLTSMNDVDTIKQNGLIEWNKNIKNFILLKQNPGSPNEIGFIEDMMATYRTNENIAKNYCNCRLDFFQKKFKQPIDYFIYRDYNYYNNIIDDDDKENSIFCKNKFNLK